MISVEHYESAPVVLNVSCPEEHPWPFLSRNVFTEYHSQYNTIHCFETVMANLINWYNTIIRRHVISKLVQIAIIQVRDLYMTTDNFLE